MNKQETAQLLTYLAELDGRKVTPATVEAWWDVLGNLPIDDCRQAVIDHNRASTDFLKPGHIASKVKDYRRRRFMDAGIEGMPQITAADEDSPDMGKTARAEIVDAVSDGRLDRDGYRRYLNAGKSLNEWLGREVTP